MDYQAAIANSGILEALAPFDPRVIGTLPLGIAVPGSDIDIACHAPDANTFADVLWRRYRSSDDFSLYCWASPTRPVIARFTHNGWPFEVFGDARPVDRQEGFRHFDVEQRLLALDDGRLRAAVMQQRMLGLKTEPAFATVLGLTGDPYRAMLDLAAESDEELRTRLTRL